MREIQPKKEPTGESPDPLEAAVESYLERYRAGESPSIGEYAGRFPERAAELREVLSALRVIEEEAGRDRIPGGDAGASLFPFAHLGDYRVLREVGRGGMGIVYEAVQESLERRVALKVLPAHALLERRRVERFRSEARAVASLHHSNIVPVYGVGEDKGVHYYAMQFIEGQPLDLVLEKIRQLRRAPDDVAADPAALSALRFFSTSTDTTASRWAAMSAAPPAPRPAPDPEPERSERAADPTGSTSLLADLSTDADPDRRYFQNVARMGLQVAEALAYAHGQGVLHRDIKPSNLLLDLDGKVWVTDFGLAKTLESDGITRSGDVVGTLAYIAPERFRGWSDPRSDIYSAGVTLYELAGLEPAFRDTDRGRLVRRISSEEPVPLRRRAPGVPRDLETIILKAIEKEPARRYPTAQQLADELRAFLEDRPIRARRARAPERLLRWCRRNPALSAMLAVVLFAVAAALGAIGYAALQRDLAIEARRDESRALAAEKEVRYWRLVHEADDLRRRRREGRRFESFERLGEAARELATLDLDDDVRHARERGLRTAVIAASSVADLRPVQRLSGILAGGGLVAFNATFERFAVALPDGVIRIHRSDGKETQILRGIGLRAQRLSFSRAEPLFLSGHVVDAQGRPARIVVWDLISGEPALARDADSYNAADLHPTLPRVALVEPSGHAVVMDVRDGTRLWEAPLAARRNFVRGVRFSPDGTRLAVVSDFGPLEVRDLEKPAAAPLVLGADSGLHALAWHPDGDRIVAAAADNRLYVLDVEGGRVVATAVGHLSHVLWPAVDTSGRLIASTSWDSVLRLWDAATGTELLGVRHLAGPDLQFAQGAPLLGPIAEGDDLVVLEVSDGAALFELHAGQTEFNDAALALGGRLLALATTRGVELWDLVRRRSLSRLEAGVCSGVFVDAESTRLVTVSVSHGIHVWPLELRSDEARIELAIGEPKLVSALPPGRSDQRSAMTTDGRWLATVVENDVLVLDLETGEATPYRTWQQNNTGVALSVDRRFLATDQWGTSDNVVLDAATGHRLALLGTIPAMRPAFAPDGRWLAVCTGTDYRFLNASDWTEVARLAREREAVPGPLAFDPRGGIAVAALRQNEPSVLELDSLGRGLPPRILATLDVDEPDPIRWLGFSADGSHLAVGWPRVLRVWDFGALRAELRRLGLDWEGRGDVPFTSSRRRLEVRVSSPRLVPLSEAARREAAERFRRELPVVSLARLDLAIARAPEDAALYRARGLELFEQREYRRALGDFRRALDRGFEDPEELRFHLGHASYLLAEYGEALGYLEGLQDRPAWNGLPAELRAQAHQHLGDWEAAIRELESLLSARSKRWGVAGLYNHLAWLLLSAPRELRRPERALELVDRALMAEPGRGVYLNTRGVALYRLGRCVEAREALESSLAAPDNAVPALDWAYLALVHLCLGTRERAEEHLEKADAWRLAHPRLGGAETQELTSALEEAHAAIGY